MPNPRALARSSNRHTPPLVLRTIEADPRDTPYGDIAIECSAEILGSAIAGASAARLHPALAALGLAKASIDLTTCLYEATTKSQVESATRQAGEICERAGGALAGFVDGDVMCLGGDTEALR